jgi:type I restriction enzyme S subunit
MSRYDFSRYSKYKYSGIPWIEQIPEHWNVDRAKSLFRKMTRNIYETDEIVTAFRDGQVTLRKNRRTSGFTNAVLESGYQGIKVGDLVVHAMDGFAGAIGTSDSNGKSSPVYSVYTPIDPKKVYTPYFGLLVRQMALSGFVASLGKGIRERSTEFRHREFAPLSLPVPPFEEQKAIVNYINARTILLDRKTALLEQKAEQYSCLKQSLIYAIVTRGLEKDTLTKDSGIQWIGQIPANWKVRRINDIAVLQKIKNLGMLERNLLSLSYGKLKRKDIETSTGLVPESFETYQIVNQGNIILRLTDLQNDWTSLRVGLSKERGIITSAYLCLRFSKLVQPAFAYYLLHFYDLSKVFYWLGSGLRQSMKFEDIKVLPFILPPIEEQKAIAEYLNSKTAHIEKIIETINTETEKLKELRKTLINDVVTGKIKVIE